MLQFTVISDALTELPLTFLWLNLYYLFVVTIYTVATIITFIATINSICQDIPSLNKRRFRTCVAICFALGCISMITTTEGAMAYYPVFKRKVSLVFLVVNVIALCGIVLFYGIKTVKHDILFIYRSPLTPLLWYSVTLLPMILLVNINHSY